MDEIEYTSDVISAAQLESEFETAFKQSQGWDLIRKRLPEGEVLVDTSKLPLVVKPRREGLDPATATIVVAAIGMASPVVQKIALDLWNEVWLPKIQAERGQNVVKPVKRK